MGIRVDFLIKHVRPADMDAWQMICQDQGAGSLAAWLLKAGVAQQDIDHAFNDWAALALLDIHDPENRNVFIQAAQDISQARWNMLYETNYSTILFLNAPLLKQLSYESSQQANKAFDFDPYEHIPLAVTINRLGQPPTVVENAVGAAVAADMNGDCYHFDHLIQGGNVMTALSSEAVRRAKRSVTLAEQIFQNAGERAAIDRVYPFFGITPAAVPAPQGLAALAADTPSKDDLNSLLNSVGTAPGATTAVTVPAAPASGDVALIQNVQTLDSYIATLTALVMYNNHPAPYDLSDKQQAAQFVIDLANARNFVVTGGTVKAIPMYLPMGEATTQSFNKTTTSADLHLEVLTALFGALNLPSGVLTELDGILTEIAGSLQNLQLSFTTQTQTLNHFVSFYYLTPVPGTNPPVNQMNVEFIYLQLAQSSWKASVGKSSVSHFTLDMTTTRTTATMSAGIVAANTSNIVSSLLALTGNDAHTISEMTKMKGVQT
ncbi:MAG: hypothetical protein M5U01_00325 [Ardenticatenaceae bacterium]|nr:hypothetical protein [Ardenticatenaceae bacterium]HBY97034.1 hypothetical protein [Chloroflexota bacterium]